jgi:predicted transposase/invertase (TIGR01784 family)
VYYSTFPIQEQAKKNNWAYELNAVYCIGILDFIFDEDTNTNKQVVQVIQLKDQENQVFYDKLQFVFVEMPRFTKAENELETRLDKWLYFIKYLQNFEVIPSLFKDDVFLQAFDAAAIANYDAAERNHYDASLKAYRDLKGVMDTSFEEGTLLGFQQGIEKGDLLRLHRTIDKCLELGMTMEAIAEINDISVEMIELYVKSKK